MRKALTAKTIDALKPKPKRYEVHDALCPGFSVRVSPQGQKTFNVKYRYGVRQRRLKLGVYPRVSLSEARQRAMAALREVDDGIDPHARRRQPNLRVEAVVEDFIRQYARPRNRSWREARRILIREFVAMHGQRDIRQVTRADILEIMDRAIDRGAVYQANRIHAHLRKLFNWCLDRGKIEASPMTGTKAPTREKSRDRVLAPTEIAQLVAACRAEPYPFGPYTLMLLITAQRRGEVANMRWSEIDWKNKVWEIPGERSKNGKPHLVPLSPLALSVLRAIPRFERCDLVFTTTRTSPISGITKMVLRLQAASETRHWRLHDLRRTAATEMAKMGIVPHVVEKVLNHVSGTISGVAAVYNRYGYDKEKRDALERWGILLEQLDAQRRGPSSFENYLCLRDAVALIGSGLVSEWRQSDLDQCHDPNASLDPNDRIRFARDRLHHWLVGGRVRAFGQNDEGAVFEIERVHLSAPFFQIDVASSQFLWAPEAWDTILVSKTDVEHRIDELRPSKARKANTFDWREITSTAWKLALGDVNLRTQARLIDAIQNVYAAQHDQHPDEKELRPLTQSIIEHLGDRVLSKDVSATESPCDASIDRE